MTQAHTLRLSSWVRLALLLCLLIGLLAVTGGLTAPRARAHAQTTFTVTDCSSDAQLQADVAQANSDNADDTIIFACSGDILLTSTLTISGSMTLDGSGQSVTLDGGNGLEVLFVNGVVSFTLNALTVANGSGEGGGLYNIIGTVTISNSTFAGNAAYGSGGAGGGLYNGGTVTITNSTFANNSGGGGGGGGLYNTGTVTISNSTFANNSAAGGGGLLNSGGTVTITNSTFANNGADEGGGLYNTGTATITNSTFANNSAGFGGGLFNSGGTVTITNSTFANNKAKRGAGGGLYNEGTVTISNSTFAYNSANRGGGLYNYSSGTLNIGGSIVANNSHGNCYGALSDQGYNLESGTDCGFTGTGDLQNTNPLLDPSGLQKNGGPTRTIALLSGSPATDTIPVANCPATDQRGVSRPDNGETTCDMGAYEFIDPLENDLGLHGLPGTITVDATSPQGAVVTYTPPTATDESGDNPGPTVNCTPASGSTFAIGTTTVTCTTSDSDDSNSPVSGSFQVVVNGAATQISALIATVNGFHFKKFIQVTLDAEPRVALKAVKQGKTRVACAALHVFIGEVKLLTGHGITSAQANQLLAAAGQVQAVLGC